MGFDQLAHDQLVQALARKLERRHRARAQVFRTHISSVIACGSFAYKLKRPVKLAFVDFSSLHLRYLDCMRELQINERTAPMLYLGVVKITGSPDQPSIGGQAHAIDWAVKMRRFKQSDLLSQRIGRNQVTAEMLCAFANDHASLMQRLEPLAHRALAKHRPAHAWLLESLDEIERAAPRLSQEVKQVRHWAHQQARQLGAMLAQRIRQGHYRDCHGDLHLANLVQIKHQIVAFDALEFNEALSQIDPINDIAFTFMDLIAHDRADLAWCLMNQWCQSRGDYRGLALLRYYTLYRAVVRAKVASLTHDSTGLQRYWGLAKQLVAKAQPARLSLVGGLSGSGKSTLARELAPQLGAIVLRADVIRKQLFGAHIDDNQALYTPAITKKTYTELARLADELTGCGVSVIVDATFIAQAHIAYFEHISKKRSVPFALVWCDAPVAVLERRIRSRARAGQDPSDATVAVLRQQWLKLQQSPIVWPKATHQIQTTVSRQQMTMRSRALARTLLEAAPKK